MSIARMKMANAEYKCHRLQVSACSDRVGAMGSGGRNQGTVLG